MNDMQLAGLNVRKAQSFSLIVGVIAIALCAIGGFVNPRQFFHSYLIAFVYCVGLSLGSMALVMVYHLTSGYWGLILRRTFESAYRTLPLVALFAVPVMFGVPRLYGWANAAASSDKLVQHKLAYLNPRFFILRTIIYFAVWLTLAHFLHRWSAAQDRSGDPIVLRRLRALSGPGAIIYGFTITFAAIDWVMSLEPEFFSTTFGFLFITGQAVNAMAFGIVVAALLSGTDPVSRLLNKDRLRDIGNMLLASIMLWAYIAFTGFLIIWAGNLPDETSWYRHRFYAGWGILAGFLIALHFAVPFLMLLMRGVKQRIRVLMWVGALLLLMRLVDIFWMVEPSEHSKLLVHWMDILAPIGLVGIWLTVFLSQLGKMPLVPAHDPLMEKELAHH